MTNPILAKTILSRLDDVERRLRALESTPRVPQVTTTGQGVQRATVLQPESTTSISYTDLATVGPTVTVQVGQIGSLLVALRAAIVAEHNEPTHIGYEIRDAANNLIASAQDDDSIAFSANTADGHVFEPTLAGVFAVTGLSSGTYTVKMKYRSGAGTLVSFLRRAIVVLPF